jgi:polyhydroxyalkanoate synthesis repressor PhaR
VATKGAPLLVKRYASRRLYNTETSDYVTLDDIAGFIRDGRDVQIIDLKSGDDLTRQYLLQIIADYESRGENMLPIAVLNDLVRSYSNQASTVMPEFLQMSFDMLRDSQSQIVENLTVMNPIANIPGFEAIKTQQETFIKAMTGGMTEGWSERDKPSESATSGAEATSENSEDLDEIKRQLADLQTKLNRMDS